MTLSFRTLTLSAVALTAATVVVGAAAPATAASLPVYSVGGTIYLDADRNGSYTFGDLPISGATVTLYSSAEDAAAGTNAVRTLTTGALGTYSATKLPAGTYYATSAAQGYQSAGTASATVSGLSLAGVANVAATKPTTLTATVFEDANGNGAKDSTESNFNGKTLIFVDVLKTKQAIEDGSLGSLDVSAAVSAAVSGSLDLGDAIRFRTTANGQSISYADVPEGAYVILRSPFNLTLGDVLANTSRITAFIDLISTGSADALLSMDPSMLDTGDISTTPRNEYLKQLASTLSRAVATVDEADTEKLLGSELSGQVSSIAGTVGQVATLISAIPATHFAVVDHWGTSWQLTGLKAKKTTDFLFGVRQPVSITGTVFNDSNANGKKDTLDLAESATLTAYTADGTVLGSTSTPSLVGSYKLGNLPYDTDIYVGIDTAKSPSVRYTGAMPAALAGKTLIGTYNLSGTGTVNAVSQDIGLAALTAPTTSVGAVNASGSAALTLTNKSSAALDISYSVNGGPATASTVPAKSILGSAGTRSIALTGLVAGQNIVTIDWKAGNYAGNTLTVVVTR